MIHISIRTLAANNQGTVATLQLDGSELFEFMFWVT